MNLSASHPFFSRCPLNWKLHDLNRRFAGIFRFSSWQVSWTAGAAGDCSFEAWEIDLQLLPSMGSPSGRWISACRSSQLQAGLDEAWWFYSDRLEAYTNLCKVYWFLTKVFHVQVCFTFWPGHELLCRFLAEWSLLCSPHSTGASGVSGYRSNIWVKTYQ